MTLEGDEESAVGPVEPVDRTSPAEPISESTEPLADASPAQLAAPPRPPSVRDTITRGLDLSLAASRDVRQASLYIGGLTLLSLGPVAAVIAAISVYEGGLDWLVLLIAGDASVLDSIPVRALFPGEVSVITGLLCFGAVAIDAQLLAVSLLGGRATGRPTSLRRALAIARSRFWRLLTASIYAGVILLIPRRIVEVTVNNAFGPQTEAAQLASTIAEAFLMAPFVYLGAGIVLGNVKAREAVARSIRLARARWRLALLVASVIAAAGYIELFAIGVGADVLNRLGIALGLDRGFGQVQAIGLGAIVAFAIVSIGSLLMTIAALTAAPQVIVFLGLTGYLDGLDEPGPDGSGIARPPSWISRWMKVGIAVAIVFAVFTIQALS